MKGNKVTYEGQSWTVTRIYAKTFQLTNDETGERRPVGKELVVFNEKTADLSVESEKKPDSSVDLKKKTSKLTLSEEEKNRRGRPQDPNSKLERCYEIYLSEHDKGRAHTMRIFSEKVGISGNCGNTYFYRCKTRATKEGLERTGGQELVSST